MIQDLSDLADQAVTVPVIVLTTLCLLALGYRRAAVGWALVTCATLGAVLASKMSVMACSARLPPAWGLHSPSGHTAAAACVFGGLAALCRPWRRRWAAGLAYGTIFAVFFGTTRLALGVHSVADVIAGGIIGIAGSTTFAATLEPLPPRSRASLYLAIATAAVIIVLHGFRLDAERSIADAAMAMWPFRLCRT